MSLISGLISYGKTSESYDVMLLDHTKTSGHTTYLLTYSLDADTTVFPKDAVFSSY